MRGITTALLVPSLLAADVMARSVPANIQALYKSIRAQGSCKNILKGGFYSQEKDSKSTFILEPTANQALHFDST